VRALLLCISPKAIACSYTLHGDVDADATAELLNVFARRFVGGMLPRWCYSLALIAWMLALAKAKVGHIRQVPPVRPIGVGGSMTRLMGGGVVTAFLLRDCQAADVSDPGRGRRQGQCR
jgi:hypothetical protein